MTRSRRTWLTVVVVAAALAVASGLATRPSVPTPSPSTDATGKGRPTTTAMERLEIGAARSQTVRARVGQPVRLTIVGAGRPDEVTIPELSQSTQIAPETPAVLDLLPDREGTYPIELQTSGEQIGALRVVGG